MSQAAPASVDAKQESTEAILRTTCGARTDEVPKLLITQAWNLQKWALADHSQSEVALALLIELAPKTPLEGMLVVQMIGAQQAATRLLHASIGEKSLHETHTLLNGAVKLMRVFNEQLEALSKLRGTPTHQKVTVEHVNVQPGGQAVIGVVESPAKGAGDGSAG